MTLFPKDSIEDLACRGISRADICALTNKDAAFVDRAIRLGTKGVDRKAYQHLYIKTHVGLELFRRILDDYNCGKLDRPGLFVACGLGQRVVGPPVSQTVQAICDYMGVLPDRRSVNVVLELFPEGSAKDLVCRCFSRDDIFNKTGVDSRGVNRLIQMELLGVDRKAYQHLHIKERVGVDAVRAALVDYGAGKIDKSGFFEACGVGRRAGSAKVFQSIQSICEYLGLMPEYEAARVQVRAAACGQALITIKEKYGADCVSHIPGVLERQIATRLEKYGYAYTFQVPSIREKSGETMIRKHGHRYSLQCDDIRAQFESKMLERHGVRFTFESPELRARATATFKARTGYDHPLKDPSVREAGRRTLERNYGVSVPMHSDVIKARVAATNQERYGVDCVLELESVKRQVAETNRRKYGVDCFLKTELFREMYRAKSIEKYGCEYPIQSAVVQQHIRESMRARHGVDYPWQNPGIYAKYRETMGLVYGETHPMRVESIRNRAGDTKSRNGTWASSGPEESLYRRLVDRFGDADVVRQYNKDSRYPYHCDFYIASRDLFIELNGDWSHFSHWFGSGEFDADVVAAWMDKGTGRYLSAAHAWTVSDVKKREAARVGNLNYVVFWSEDGLDIDLWFALGCPDGRDWEREYSWVPVKELECEQELPVALSVDDSVLRDIVRVAHWPEFYARETEYWRETFDEKWGTRQVRQYSKVLRKSPDLPFDMITSQVILDSLNYSGVVSGYSEFHASGLSVFLEKYRPEFLYDPCAGWGEPLVACAGSHVKCFGYSADDSVAEGYGKIKSAYDLQEFDFMCGSGVSGVFDFSGGDHDAVFVWLPRESVSGMPEDVLARWWQDIVSGSTGRNTRVFGYQARGKVRDVLGEVLSAAGWRKEPHIPVRVPGVTRPVEYVEVFVRL